MYINKLSNYQNMKCYYYNNNPVKVNFGASQDNLVKVIENRVNPTEVSANIKQFLKIFNTTPKELPSNLSLKTSPNSEQVLGFTAILRNNNLLEAVKHCIHKNCKNYFYITVKEYENDKLKRTFAIDMENNEFVRVKKEGAIRFQKEDLIRISPDSSACQDFNKILSRYLTDIFSTKSSKRTKKAKKQEQMSLIIGNKNTFTNYVQNYMNISSRKYNINPSISPTEYASRKNANIPPILLNNVKNNINRNPIGKIPSELSMQVSKIELILSNIITLLDKNRGNMDKIKQLKNGYEPLDYKWKRKKTIDFKLLDGNTLGIIHTKMGQNYTRIIYKSNTGEETHILIKDTDKIISNLNKNNPWVMPVKLRYMTQEQITASNVDKYIPFLYEHLKNYYDYLSANL